MVTSNGPVRPPGAPPVPARARLRLSLVREPGEHRLDGGWWPRSRDLAAELSGLLDEWPPRLGAVVRALVSPVDWDAVPGALEAATGRVEVGALPPGASHLLRLTLSDGAVLDVLVVPPGLSDDQGEEAMLAAATRANAHSATDLLAEVMDAPEVDRRDRWTDDGDSWWGPDAVPPSFREGG
jgi:hypothetical protein